MFKFIREYVDEGNTVEINVNGVATIERISPNQVRVSYYRRKCRENIIVASFIWDREEWMAMWETWDRDREHITRECREMLGGNGERWKELN